MKLDHYSSGKLKKEILAIVGKYLDLKKYKVFVFSSRVKGNTDDRADIDIGIEGSKALPPGVLSDIQEEIDNLPTLYSIDVVDFKIVGAEFKKIALKNTEPIN